MVEAIAQVFYITYITQTQLVVLPHLEETYQLYVHTL